MTPEWTVITTRVCMCIYSSQLGGRYTPLNCVRYTLKRLCTGNETKIHLQRMSSNALIPKRFHTIVAPFGPRQLGKPTCVRCIGQIVAQPRVLPQLPTAQVQYPRAHGILQSPVQATGRVVLLLVLVLVYPRAPVGSTRVVMAL